MLPATNDFAFSAPRRTAVTVTPQEPRWPRHRFRALRPWLSPHSVCKDRGSPARNCGKYSWVRAESSLRKRSIPSMPECSVTDWSMPNTFFSMIPGRIRSTNVRLRFRDTAPMRNCRGVFRDAIWSVRSHHSTFTSTPGHFRPLRSTTFLLRPSDTLLLPMRVSVKLLPAESRGWNRGKFIAWQSSAEVRRRSVPPGRHLRSDRRKYPARGNRFHSEPLSAK